jgi:PEP-CTERM motif-containing protein
MEKVMKAITKLQKITGFAALMLGLLMFGNSANAVPMNYQWDLYGNYGPGNTVLGTSATYSDNGYDLTFSGKSGGVDTALVENNRGTNEEGLGVDGSGPICAADGNCDSVDADNGELNLGQNIKIDLGANWFTLDDWAVVFNSVDSEEMAIIFQGGVLASEVAPGSQDWISFIPTAQYVFVLVASTCTVNCDSTDDILLRSVKARTPEPGTLIMMAIGLGLLGFSRRKSA